MIALQVAHTVKVGALDMGTEVYTLGALRSHLVAQLAGTSASQLSRWHRTAVISATVLPGGRGHRRLYSWIEYSKVRAAVKLLEQRLSPHHLRSNLRKLDEEIAGWYRLPLLAYRSHVVVPASDGYGFTILEKQGVMSDFVDAADTGPVPVGRDMIDHALQVVRELQAEGPLGKLRDFGEHITLDPEINQGSPILIGTRLETAHLAAIRAKGFQTVSEIAERYRLEMTQVEAAIEFERALAA